MIFALETDEQTLYRFTTDAEAIAYCEGVDVEAGIWLFWDAHGRPLAPRFITPNRRGILTVLSGHYLLEPTNDPLYAPLDDVLDEIQHLAIAPPLSSVTAIRDYLASGNV